jgi:RNA polymerase subunit RPABC4/transcription elongation factor Spt4
MEQPCYKCGQVVEEGRPFCPHCGAPLIRVLIAEPETAVAAYPIAASNPRSESDIPSSQSVPLLAVPMHWSQALRPCFLAALVALGLMTLGLHPFVAMSSVGFLAVFFYRQRRREATIRGLTGAGVGALGGLLWFVMASILEVSLILITHKGPELQAELLSKLEQASKQAADPQVTALFDKMKSPGGLEVLMISGIIFAFVASIVLASLTGALGAIIFGRRKSG